MKRTVKPPVSFWVVAVFAIFWNVIEIYLTTSQMDLLRNNLTAEEYERIHHLPFWYVILFMAALFSEMLGAFLLFMRRRLAQIFFGVAAIALVFVELYWLFFISIRKTSMTLSIIIPLLVLIIAGFLYFYSRYANRKGWLK